MTEAPQVSRKVTIGIAVTPEQKSAAELAAKVRGVDLSPLLRDEHVTFRQLVAEGEAVLAKLREMSDGEAVGTSEVV